MSHTSIWEGEKCIAIELLKLQTYNNKLIHFKLLVDVRYVLLPSANEVCEGYVFTCVCHSVHRGGLQAQTWGEVGGLAGGSPDADPGGRLGGLAGRGVSRPRPGGSRPRPVGGGRFIPACIEADTPPPADGHCCGRYASYWNAFLFLS